MPNLTWTPTDDADLTDDWTAGTSVKRMAHLYGCSRSSILRQVRRLGLPYRRTALDTNEERNCGART